MKKFLLLLAITLTTLGSLNAQVAINRDGSHADSSAMLDVKATDKGMLIPRLSGNDILAINKPANGLTVFNTDNDKFYVFIKKQNRWKEIAFGAGTIDLPFVCGESYLYDDRDGQSYKTVQIGTQCWMAENINIGTMLFIGTNQSDNGIIEKYCYDDDPANCDIYGGMYDAREMMQYNEVPGSQGICPDGWHVATDDEFKTLEMFLGMTQAQADATEWRGTDEGGKLKESGTAHWATPNTGATNSSGFTALPGGWTFATDFYQLNHHATIWTSSTSYPNYYFEREMYNNKTQIRRIPIAYYAEKNVRCIKD